MIMSHTTTNEYYQNNPHIFAVALLVFCNNLEACWYQFFQHQSVAC